MESKTGRSAYLARIISKITNPCILSVLVLLLMAYAESTDVRMLIGQAVVVFLFLVLLPLVYVYLRTLKSGKATILLTNPTLFLRQHPGDILVLSLFMGLACLIVLVFLDAPPLLLATLAALLASSIVAALLNMFFRASYHLTAVTVLVIMAALAWGQIYLLLLAAIPLVAWAKYRIHEHTPAQLVVGVAVAAVLSGIIIGLTSIM
jgi:hypothetical protein